MRHRCETPALELSELVSRTVSIRLHDIPTRGELNVSTSAAADDLYRGLTERQTATPEFALDVRTGMSKVQKELPPKWLYDEVGSALFEVITVLPEYGLTRAEERLLRQHANEVAWRLGPVSAVAELGSGSGRKTRPILEAIAHRQGCVSYCAIDVSAAALENCRQHLSGLDAVRSESLQKPYLEGLEEFVERRSAGPLLVLFLGSSIGNLHREEAEAFLRRVRNCLLPGDALLLGTDLIKSPGRLLAAYDDAAGVTAAFDLNILARINRELEGDFQVRNFQHEARWCKELSRIEMHLVSKARQVVTIPGADCQASFEKGESIWTESCYKFDPSDSAPLAQRTGFVSVAQWIDREWWFGEDLWVAGA